MKEFFKKIDFKSGLLYFGFIECGIIIFSFFLAGIVVMPVRFIFNEPGTPREIAEFVVTLVVELLIRFIIFYGYFKNNRRLTYKQFCINYSVTYILRLIFSLATTFAAFSAGMSVLLSGTLMTSAFIEKDIITMHDVPTALYIFLFTLLEALTLLITYLESRLAEHKREKTRQQLINEHKENQV